MTTKEVALTSKSAESCGVGSLLEEKSRSWKMNLCRFFCGNCIYRGVKRGNNTNRTRLDIFKKGDGGRPQQVQSWDRQYCGSIHELGNAYTYR